LNNISKYDKFNEQYVTFIPVHTLSYMSSRFNRLPSLESNFKVTQAANLTPLTYTSGSENLLVSFYESLNIFHFKEPAEKKRIILHFTAGPLSSDIPQLTPAIDRSNKFVSVPFVVGRDGTIYQLFSSKHWAFNLGMKAADGNVNHIFERESIAIEISNYGLLIPDGNQLKTIYDRPGRPDIYCSLDQTDAYVELNAPFRKHSFYATYSDLQMKSLIDLLRWLTDKYHIPLEILPEDLRYDCNSTTQNFKGITSHVNYRKEGKWDIGTAFDWDGLLAGVRAPSTTTRSVRKSAKQITEESSLIGKTRGAKYSKDMKIRIPEYDPFEWER